MTPLGLTDQQLKTVLDVAGFVPRRLRRKFLKDIAAQLPVVPGTKKSLSTLRDSDVERAIGDVLVTSTRSRAGAGPGASGPEGRSPRALRRARRLRRWGFMIQTLSQTMSAFRGEADIGLCAAHVCF